jgi:excisionase family DNA binding protein
VTASARKSKPANSNDERGIIFVDGQPDPNFMKKIALSALGGVIAFLRYEHARRHPTAEPLEAPVANDDREVMTADEVAAFLGVDRNTVYDYAGRGVIPHQRLGKRILFRRGALVAWLDASCKATSTRKG